MSEDTSDLTVTLKAGTGYDSPWIVVRGDNPDDVAFKLRNIGDVIEATHEAAGLFAAGRLAAPQGGALPVGSSFGGGDQANAPTAPPAKQQGWGQQQGSAPQQRKSFGVPHPEGKTCDACPEVLVQKETGQGKKVWRCPSWRWNNGQPNGHSQVWID